MARAAVRGRLARPLQWRVARLVAVRDETPTARTLVLDVEGWSGHLAGQHVDVRLTAEDGYSAQRSYSIASAPGEHNLELTIQRLPDGEISPFLARDYALGDPLEVRGPVGGWFVWRPEQREPVLLLAGGSGVVPLMSMVRARVADRDASAPFHLIYSVRTPADVYYADELDNVHDTTDGVSVSLLFTREAPAGSPRPPHRLTAKDLRDLDASTAASASAYVCGPTSYVESVADLLVDAGFAAARIRTERFGPTGG